MAKGCHCPGLNLIWKMRYVIKTISRKFSLSVPVHQLIYEWCIASFVVVNDHVDKVSTDTKSTAECAMSSVTGSCMFEHIVRQSRPWITNFLF